MERFKNFKTLNDFDKYIEPQDYALDYLNNTVLTKYIKRKKKAGGTAQEHKTTIKTDRFDTGN